jgi:hypothetical protein
MTSLFGGSSRGASAPGPGSSERIEAAATEIEMVADIFNKIVRSCHSKCITPRYTESTLNKGEGVCVDRCGSDPSPSPGPNLTFVRLQVCLKVLCGKRNRGQAVECASDGSTTRTRFFGRRRHFRFLEARGRRSKTKASLHIQNPTSMLLSALFVLSIRRLSVLYRPVAYIVYIRPQPSDGDQWTPLTTGRALPVNG